MQAITNCSGLTKGQQPWKFTDLKSKLRQIWKINGDWKLISLGRGVFQIQFPTLDEKNRVWALGSFSLNLGILRLQQWSPDFNPYKQKITTAR